MNFFLPYCIWKITFGKPISLWFFWGGGGGGWCLFVCFRSQPAQKNAFLLHCQQSTQQFGVHSKVLLLVWDFLGDTVSPKIQMPKDKNAWFFLFLSYSWRLILKKEKEQKGTFMVRTEEITLGVCHRLDRKSHYKLTPELEFQLTTSTTRAFTLFSQTGHPAERNTFPWVRGKLCPHHCWDLGGNSLSISPYRQECAAGQSLQLAVVGVLWLAVDFCSCGGSCFSLSVRHIACTVVISDATGRFVGKK